jgi:hypothetical protein
MVDDFFTRTHCDRCRRRMNGHTMSKFNLDVICFPCKEDERQAPGYKAADEAEMAAVRAGVKDFPGVGLGPADEAFLAQRRAARKDEA